MNKYAILSTDNNPSYYELLPLVCHSWQKLGYRPVIIFVNVPHIIWQIIMYACPGAFSSVEYSREGVKDSTMAQLKRLFIGLEEWPDDILLTADADMVIARDIFTHDVSRGQIISYGYDLTGRSELPICYVKATAAKWRELMGEFHIPEKAYSDRWEDYWSVDQQLLTQRAREYGMEKITFIDRGNQNKHGLPTGRWDRHDWAHIPDSIIDVHMKRNDWAAQIEVFQKLWPGEDHSFITKFREALRGYELTDPSKEVTVNLDGVALRALAVDTDSLDRLMKATNEIAEAYNYPAQLIESYGVELKEPVNINDIYGIESVRINILDDFGFLEGVTGNWNNHLPLLLLGLYLTGGDVLELGSGEGSTGLLRAYCEANGRLFRSWDNSLEWSKKVSSGYTQNWDETIEGAKEKMHGLIFIDHAPGERRHLDAVALANAADILVLHDTEEGGAGDYKFEKIWHMFKYRLNYNKTGGGAGATAVSNTIDLNQFRGLSLGSYTFDND